MGFNNENAQQAGRPWLVFDIETGPIPDVAVYLTDPIEAPANYKDPLKIAAYVAEKRQEQIARAALDLDLCEVMAIGIGLPLANYVQTRTTTSEADMIRGFWRFVTNLYREGGVLVGFNILAFDLPVLLRRSLYLGLETPSINMDRYRHDGVIDVLDVLTFTGRHKMRSLGFYCRRFGVPYDDSVKGEDVPQLVAESKWDAVTAHVRGDVAATSALAHRMGVIYVPEPEQVIA